MGQEHNLHSDQFIDLHHWSDFTSLDKAKALVGEGGGLHSYATYYGVPDEGGSEGLVWAFNNPERGWNDRMGASGGRNIRISFRIPKSEAVYQGDETYGVERSVLPSEIYRYTYRSE